MLMKYIEFMVKNNNKDYSLYKRILKFDDSKSTLILPNEYALDDINKYNYLCDDVINDLIKYKYYSSISNIKRALKNGVLEAKFSIMYLTDINKASYYYQRYENTVTNIEDLDKYCSGIQYEYNIISKELKRYEMYGMPMFGEEYLYRPLEYYKY